MMPKPVVDPPGGYRPEVAAESFGFGDLWVAAASVRGYLHQTLDPATVRQDSFTVAAAERGGSPYVVAAVADGVGQGDYSHIVADRAAEAARRLVLAELPGLVDWAAVSAAARATVRSALIRMLTSTADGEEPSDAALARYASTTLSVLVVGPEVEGRREVTSARLAGDGNAYLMDPERGWQRLHGGKAGDVVLNKVTPLPRDPGEPDVVTVRLNRGQAAVLATDGIADQIHDGSRTVAAYLLGTWRGPLATAEYLGSVSYIYLSSDDDRTAVTVWWM